MNAGRDKFAEERVGRVGLAQEFGMELHGNKPRVIWKFDDFYQAAIG